MISCIFCPAAPVNHIHVKITIFQEATHNFIMAMSSCEYKRRQKFKIANFDHPSTFYFFVQEAGEQDRNSATQLPLGAANIRLFNIDRSFFEQKLRGIKVSSTCCP